MIPMQASEIAVVVNGTLHGSDVLVSEAPVIDSRVAIDGSLFLAVQGENVDGHGFVDDAFAHGAVLAITSKPVSQRHIIVDDVVAALGKLAQHVRSNLLDLTVIGITGSQGKTTTKELLASILSSAAPTVAPHGNFNNEIGAPISLLHCTETTKYCIVEMGARHPGDIAHLCSIAQPNIGVVLRVGSAHVGEFGSMQAIAETKSELIQSLGPEGIAILGTYDDFTPAMARAHKGKTLTFGESSECDIRATDIEVREGRAHFDLITPEGRSAVGLRIVGLHQVANALAVASVATVLGFSLDQIASGLSTAESEAKWRMEIEELPSLVLINDAYNASPEATAAALQTLALFAQERGGESWAFLGKMHELGESSNTDHAAIGTLASELGIDHLVCVGAPEYAASISASSATSIHRCADIAEAIEVANNLSKGDVVLVKASRSEKLEILADAISAQWLRSIQEGETE
ncbi:MAG: UDP-N-acetylmuramoyl-tripeptide--D-alanyl-D-alanine ligase [Actinomycetota bacterium]